MIVKNWSSFRKRSRNVTKGQCCQAPRVRVLPKRKGSSNGFSKSVAAGETWVLCRLVLKDRTSEWRKKRPIIQRKYKLGEEKKSWDLLNALVENSRFSWVEALFWVKHYILLELRQHHLDQYIRSVYGRARVCQQCPQKMADRCLESSLPFPKWEIIKDNAVLLLF